MKKLFLVDDHKMLRAGIKAYINENSDWTVQGEAESVAQVRKLTQNFTRGDGDVYVAVVDIQLKEDSAGGGEYVSKGFEAVQFFADKGIPSVIFSSHDTGACIERAMGPGVGAKGFVSKCSDEKTLLEAINTVAAGRTYIQPDLVTGLLATRSLFAMLTKREQQVVKLIETGLANEEIAAELGIKITTLENYISVIYDKLGCKDRTVLLEKLRQ